MAAKSKKVTITRGDGTKVKVTQGGATHKRHLAAKKAARTRAKGKKR